MKAVELSIKLDWEQMLRIDYDNKAGIIVFTHFHYNFLLYSLCKNTINKFHKLLNWTDRLSKLSNMHLMRGIH